MVQHYLNYVFSVKMYDKAGNEENLTFVNIDRQNMRPSYVVAVVDYILRD